MESLTVIYFYRVRMVTAVAPEITRIESTEFAYKIEDVGYSPNGFSVVFEPGETNIRKLFGVKIHTDTGITGEYVGGNSPGFAQVNMVADYLVGKNPLDRERHWSEMKRALRKYDRMGMGPLDIALWDFAGKYHDAPIHQLLGTYRRSIPAYASTYHGDENGGLDSPEAFADFARECRDVGYRGFKIHGCGGGDESRDLPREIAALGAVGEAQQPVRRHAERARAFGHDLRIGKPRIAALEQLRHGRAVDPDGPGEHALVAVAHPQRLAQPGAKEGGAVALVDDLRHMVIFITNAAKS